MMKVKIKKMHPKAQIPKYQTSGAAGFDLTCVDDVVLSPGQKKVFSTGLAFEVPKGYELRIQPRSGLSLKTGLRISNSPGCVDSDFRDAVGLILENTGDQSLIFPVGDRIAQGIISPVIRATFIEDELSDTPRGKGGFGHTGNNTTTEQKNRLQSLADISKELLALPVIVIYFYKRYFKGRTD